ncbi:MAG: DUF4179 domain-containing protein [Syntrophomonadaceae bacterium]
MLTRDYKDMNEQISPSDELIIKTKAAMQSKLQRQSKMTARFVSRPLAITAIICLCMLVTIPVMAATIPSFNNLLYLVSPQIARFLQPIELSSQSNGIKMDVVAAMNDDDTVVIYLNLQDLTEDRIDNTVDLYHYSLRSAATFTHELVDYDEETKTATIRMLASGASNLNGPKITFQLNSFLSGKKFYQDEKANVDMSNIAVYKPETIPLDMARIPGGGGPGFKVLKQQDEFSVLKPHQSNKQFGPEIDFVSISNIGYVDGLLHIQTDWQERTNEKIDNHGYILLRNESGEEIHPYANLYFDVDENENTVYGNRYQEEVYKISPDVVGNYLPYGYLVKNGRYVEGDWSVTFNIKAVSDNVLLAEDARLDNAKIDELSVTPIGIKIKGRASADEISVEVIMNDGMPAVFNHVISREENGITTIKYIADMPIDIRNIQEVRINGHTVLP